MTVNLMQRIGGLWYPHDVGLKWQHALTHVRSLEWSLARCAQHRTAVQAGGNVGLWPRRMAELFSTVYTFEPEPLSLACLRRNVPANVIVSAHALGDETGLCGIERKSLGSHQVIAGNGVAVTTVDALGLDDVDLLQLDIEGYEWHALMGAADTIQRCRPLIHLELRDFTAQYGQSDAAVRAWLTTQGYREVSRQPGNDVVFAWQA